MSSSKIVFVFFALLPIDNTVVLSLHGHLLTENYGKGSQFMFVKKSLNKLSFQFFVCRVAKEMSGGDEEGASKGIPDLLSESPQHQPDNCTGTPRVSDPECFPGFGSDLKYFFPDPDPGQILRKIESFVISYPFFGKKNVESPFAN